MFNLNDAISQWRRQMADGGIKSSETLDELESHLREEVRVLVSHGAEDSEAFRLAVSRLGDADSVGNEFKKLGAPSSTPLKLGILLWGSIATALVACLITGFVPGKPSLLLSAHIFTLTAGYCAAFVTGLFGVYSVCCRWLRVLSPARQQALSRAAFSFSRLAVGLVVAGLLLGMFWSWRNLGRHFVGGPKEIGAIFAFAWLIAFWLMQQFADVNDRVRMLLCIGGNMIVGLAWFGTGIIAHGSAITSYWPLNAFLGVHLFFLAMGIVPGFEPAET